MTQGSVNQLWTWAQGQGWDNAALLEEAFQAGFLDPTSIVFDTLGGGASAGAGYTLNKLVTPILANYGDQVFRGGVHAIRFTPVTEGLQVSLVFEGRTIVIPAGHLESIIKALAAGSYEVASELLEELVDSAIQEQLQQQTTQSTP